MTLNTEDINLSSAIEFRRLQCLCLSGFLSQQLDVELQSWLMSYLKSDLAFFFITEYFDRTLPVAVYSPKTGLANCLDLSSSRIVKRK